MSGLQQLAVVLLAGLSFGSIYSMMAIGFSLLWQTSRTINFAQGDFATLAGFLLIAFVVDWKTPLVLGAILAVVCVAVVLGYVFRATIIRRMHGRGLMSVVIATFALSTVIENGLAALWTPQPLAAPSIVPTGTWHVGGVPVGKQTVFDFAVAAVMLIGLELFLNRTRTGLALQATAQNAPVARMLGLNTRRMITYAFVINAVLAGAAGVLLAHIYFAQWDNGLQLGLYAFYAAIIGGLNSPRGALVGGLVVGLVQSISAAYISSTYASGILVAALIATVLVRPQGLLGQRELVKEYTA